MTYQESLDWLYRTQLFGIKLGLENVERLCGECGIAVDSPGILHVAGTNGKGSVCAFAERLLRESGRRVGLFTSPHLVDFRERIRIGQEMISEEAVAEGLGFFREQVAEWEPHPTFFELTFALAMKYFQEEAVEAVVLETGMGGRLDATNLVQPRVVALTPVGLDHQKWLGESLREIAQEKAGILKVGVPAVSAGQVAEVAEVLWEQDPAIEFVKEPIPGEWDCGLPGQHQRANAALAWAALKRGGWEVGPETARRAIAATRWPGRFEEVRPRLVLDGAHNESAMEALVATWRARFGAEKASVVFGALADKQPERLLKRLGPIAREFVFVPVNSPRALPVRDLGKAAAGKVPWQTEVSLEAALSTALASNRATLVTGSLFLVGEASGLLRSEAFRPSAQ
ncbi:MAG: folylpolyglutamate synthase/dihydrofolate synthase family protein [Verrucomicrobiota bacterium]